jgi:hypothetical protein
MKSLKNNIVHVSVKVNNINMYQPPKKEALIKKIFNILFSEIHSLRVRPSLIKKIFFRLCRKPIHKK